MQALHGVWAEKDVQTQPNSPVWGGLLATHVCLHRMVSEKLMTRAGLTTNQTWGGLTTSLLLSWTQDGTSLTVASLYLQ